jgi:hypothetical protein
MALKRLAWFRLNKLNRCGKNLNWIKLQISFSTRKADSDISLESNLKDE